MQKIRVLLTLVLALTLTACAAAQPAAEMDVPVVTSTPKPTPQPTIEPTPEPTIEPTPSPSPVPELSTGYYDAFFNNAVFIGDSITQGLQNYVIQARKTQPNLLGNAKFAAAKSFGLEDASANRVGSDSAALRYRGKSMTVVGIIEAMEVDTVFIMLGVNDWAGSHIEQCLEQYGKLLTLIQEDRPEVAIYVQSCTPVTKERERDKLNNENLDAFNAALRDLCEQMGVRFIDIATALKDDNNALDPFYSSDKYVHVSAEGAQVWIDSLYQYAYDAAMNGVWEAPAAPVAEPASAEGEE